MRLLSPDPDVSPTLKSPQVYGTALAAAQTSGSTVGANIDGKHEHKAIFIQLQIEITDIFCIGNHISVEIILKSVNTVNIDSGYTAVEEQTLLIVHPVFVKTLYGIIRRILRFKIGSPDLRIPAFWLSPGQEAPGSM